MDPLYDWMDCNDFEYDFEEAKLKFDICISPSRSAKGIDCGVSFLNFSELIELFK